MQEKVESHQAEPDTDQTMGPTCGPRQFTEATTTSVSYSMLQEPTTPILAVGTIRDRTERNRKSNSREFRQKEEQISLCKHCLRASWARSTKQVARTQCSYISSPFFPLLCLCFQKEPAGKRDKSDSIKHGSSGYIFCRFSY